MHMEEILNLMNAIATRSTPLPMTVLLATLLMAFAGCSTWDKLNKTEKGAVIGGTSGAVIGGETGGTGGAILGGTAGAAGGGLIGREMDKEDEDRDDSVRFD